MPPLLIYSASSGSIGFLANRAGSSQSSIAGLPDVCNRLRMQIYFQIIEFLYIACNFYCSKWPLKLTFLPPVLTELAC